MRSSTVKGIMFAAMLGIAASTLAACQKKEGPMEEIGEEIDEAVDNAKDAVD